MAKQCYRQLGSVAAALALASCVSHQPAPVTDLSGAPVEAAPVPVESEDAYKVVRGDSLYSIAMRESLDWRALAYWNDIAAPYTIRPGMRLQLRGPPVPAVATPSPRTESANTSEAAQFEPLPEPVTEPSDATVASAATSASPIAPVVSQPPAAEPAPPAEPSSPVVAPAAVRRVGSVTWSWPSIGAVVAGFAAGDPMRRGIDIGGQRGDPVLAAAAGTVVYSGNALVGYGELIIIKHSDKFLSAYAHNSRRLVQEGDRVARGQKIAEMGSTGASRVALHFQVRSAGQPVDPLAFLPNR